MKAYTSLYTQKRRPSSVFIFCRCEAEYSVNVVAAAKIVLDLDAKKLLSNR